MRDRITLWRGRTWRILAFPLVVGVAIAGLLAGGPSQATVARPTAAAAAQVMPNKVNLLDCNGWSSKYETLGGGIGALCTDPIAVKHGKASRFIDNHWYVGHDEPSVKFISYAKGSGNTMTYFMTVPRDPAKTPTATGSVTKYGELSVAPWFGLPLCDPKSYPQNRCRTESDANIGTFVPQAAGSAFMELQFYPPGFTPFIDNTSCSTTQWCAALTIDSLECNFSFSCNPACTEPVNFSFLQTDGVPPGPPSPQLADVSTFMGNAKTLKINQGDSLQVSITDPSVGFTAAVTDLTTHQTGTMTASAANGFMNTSIKNCAGTPFTFRAEYNTAAPQNQVPWAALEGGVLMEEEIGHGEACSSVANKEGFSAVTGNGQSYVDPNVYQTCVGGMEGATAKGEGPCVTLKTGSIKCTNPMTQGPRGPAKCGTTNPLSGALCEFSDGSCFPKGSRPVVINGVPSTETSPVAICYQNNFENGDLDFDGTGYHAVTWPDGTANHPTPIAISGPYTRGFATYPSIQFETDLGGSSALCNTGTGAGCFAPPIGAAFYPFYTLSESAGGKGVCDWNFGKVIPGKTASALGGTAQYGSPDVARYGGTLTSAVQVNPATAFVCDGTTLRAR